MTISFGIEFEFDYIKRTGEIVILRGEPPEFLASNWDYQGDYTASTELRSPVFTSLEQFIEECNRQFNGMISRNDNIIPYMYNSEGRSLGQHIHIGRPNTSLTYNVKYKIARAIIEFYPFLASIHAQPIPSRRGLTSMYTQNMYSYRDFISGDHYAEISDSHIGTVEFRVFDSNIPQASLVCVWFMTNIVKKAFRSRANENEYESNSFNWEEYNNERTRALRFGLVSLNVTDYLKKFRNIVGNIDIPDIPCLKEMLYLIAKYRLNFYGLYKYVNAKPYDYMKYCLSDISKYFENIIRINNINHEEKIRRWINDSMNIENLEQLIGLSIGVDKALSEQLFVQIEERLERNPEIVRNVETDRRVGLSRNEVREAIERGNYRISRIREIVGYSVESVAAQINYWLVNHGEGLVNVINVGDIISSPSRFYVFYAYNPISNRIQLCGTIAVNRRSGEIHSLVVDRRFRGLGIARMLVQYAIEFLRTEGLDRAYAWIRNNNNASINLFTSLGFKPEKSSKRSTKYILVLR